MTIQTKKIDKGDWFSYKYGTNIITINKTGESDYPDYLRIVFTLTMPNNRKEGLFKSNAKNILKNIKKSGFKGLIIREFNKLSHEAKGSILSGVKNGWIIEEKINEIYIIEEIK